MSKGLQKFLSYATRELDCMYKSSILEREKELRKWKDVVKYLYKEHYLLQENESHADSPAFAFVFDVEIQRNLQSNSPYVSDIVSDPSNALTPIISSIEEMTEKKNGYISNSKKTLEEYKKYLDIIKDNIEKTLSNNEDMKNIQNTGYSEIRLFGNTCIYRYHDQETGQFKLKNIPLNTISINKDFMTGNILYYFYTEYYSFVDFSKYFTSEEARNALENYYSAYKEPEKMFLQVIPVNSVTYYCDINKKSYTRHYINDDIEKDLEPQPKVCNYESHLYLQVNGANKTYGRIDDKDAQIISTLKDKQLVYRNLLQIIDKIGNPETFDPIKSYSTSDIEYDVNDSTEMFKYKRHLNSNQTKTKNLPADVIASFNGNLRKQSLEDPENITKYQYLSQIHNSNIEEFATFLGFDEAQKKALLPIALRQNTTATEFKELLLASTTSIRQLNILEYFTSSIYSYMITYYIGFYIERIVQLYNEKGDAIEDYIGENYDELINKIYMQAMSLDIPTEEISNKNYFKIWRKMPYYIETKKAMDELRNLYNKAQTEEEKAEYKNAMLELETEYKDIVEIEGKKLLLGFSNEKIQLETFGAAEVSILEASKEFINFLFYYHKYSKSIKFELASPQYNAIKNQKARNYINFADTVLQKVISTQDPEIVKKGITMLDLINSLGEIGNKVYNLNDYLLTGKDLEKRYTEDMEKLRQQQIELAQQTNPAFNQ